MIMNCGQVLVDDQDKALRFYTEKLGYVKIMDVPDGDSGMRSLIVESPSGIQGVGLELMGTYTPAAHFVYQQAMRGLMGMRLQFFARQISKQSISS